MTKSITQKTSTKQVQNLKNYFLSCATQIKYFTCLLILLFSSISWGQNASQYAFSQSNGTYTPLVSPTVLGSGSTLDDTTYSIAAGSLSGFSFNFAGTNYTAFTVSPNGFIGLGSSLMAGSTYTPLSSSSGGNVFIAAYGDDLGGLDANTQISWKLEGTTPNRELVVEYRNMRNYGRADVNLTFQIRLVETANVVKIVYGTMTYTSATQDSSQVGIKSSATSSHFSNRSTTTNWNSTNTGSSNSSTCRVLNTVTMPTSGLTFTFTPPTPCSGTPTAGTISTANQYLCSGATVPNLVNTGFSSGVTGITFQWQQSTDDATWSNVTTGTGATTATYTPPVFAGTTIYYRCNVTCANGGGTAATPSVSINPPANPSTQVTNAVASSISYTGFTTTWVNGNGNRRVVYLSDTAIVDPSNVTGAAAHTANTVYAGSGQQIIYDGTATSVSVTGLTLGTTYYVKVIEYTRCGAAPYDYYYSTISGTNAISVTTLSPTAVPWNEGFATTTLPSGWLNPSSLTIASNVSSLNPALSTNYMYVNLYDYYYFGDNYLNTTANFSTPIFASLPSNYRIVFDYKINDYGTSTAPGAGTGNIVVAISTNNGSTFTTLQTIDNNGITGWQNVAIDLSSYASQNIRLKFTANETTTEIDYYVAFDNFSVEAIPSCLPPSTLVLSSITNNSASLSWTASASAPGSGYEVYYSTANTAPTAGTTPSANVPSGTTYAYSGLTASTTYYSWVRSNCGSGDVSTWVASASFTTQCNPVSVPYSQDFESVTTPALPICTSIENAGTGNNWKTASPAGYGFTTKCLNYSYNGTNAANAWFFTAGINLTAGTSYRISYNYGTPSTTYFPENLKVAYGVSALSTSMTTTLATHTNILDITAPLSTVDFTPGTTGVYYFGFNAFSDANMNQLYVDNISIKVTPNTWTGTTSSSWNTAGNWSLNTVPTTSDNIVISSGTNAPVLDVDLTIPVGKSLTLSGTGTLTIAPGKTLTIAGTADFGGKAVTFKSDATGSGMFGPLTGTLTGATNVKVERYIPAKRAYRFVSSPVTTTTTIKQNWQENAGTTAGLGTHITGTGGATNGFDATSTDNPSMYTFTGGAWAAVANTNVNVLTAGTPYRLMVRGDRLTDLTTNTPTATVTTLRATGTLKTGNFVPTINQTADGYSLVGNPYQAPIDIKAILTASSNMSSGVVYYWDPTLNARGGYVTRNLTTDVNDVTSSFNQYVQPGQAVFVKRDNTANAASVTITESHKSVANGAAGVFRTTTPNDYGLLRVNLQANTNNQWQTIEGTLALFNDNFSWNVTSEDATKMSNLDEEVSFVQNNTSLAIACVSAPSVTSELPIQLNNLRHSNYQWQFELANYQGERPYLYDTQNNTYTEITNGTTVPFTATTAAANRFKIVFQNSTLGIDDFTYGLVLYPNPAKAGDSFYVQGSSAAEVTVYNVLGQHIPVQVKAQGNALQVTPAQTLSQGIYLVTVTTEGKTQHVKWIVE
jgi:hypothetical protein